MYLSIEFDMQAHDRLQSHTDNGLRASVVSLRGGRTHALISASSTLTALLSYNEVQTGVHGVYISLRYLSYTDDFELRL